MGKMSNWKLPWNYCVPKEQLHIVSKNMGSSLKMLGCRSLWRQGFQAFQRLLRGFIFSLYCSQFMQTAHSCRSRLCGCGRAPRPGSGGQIVRMRRRLPDYHTGPGQNWPVGGEYRWFRCPARGSLCALPARTGASTCELG